VLNKFMIVFYIFSIESDKHKYIYYIFLPLDIIMEVFILVRFKWLNQENCQNFVHILGLYMSMMIVVINL